MNLGKPLRKGNTEEEKAIRINNWPTKRNRGKKNAPIPIINWPIYKKREIKA